MEIENMEIDETVAAKAYDVVQRYIVAINAGDGAAVQETLNFPHFRIGAKGNVIHYPDDSADHLGNFRRRTNADGWHRSVVDRMQAIFTIVTKAHVAVNFRRLRADGSEIGAYHSLYIITRIDGHWAIQGGSGTGT
ncbi:MAG: hypothetical protein VCF08_21420 [Alphaproteobacteria bacterium]